MSEAPRTHRQPWFEVVTGCYLPQRNSTRKVDTRRAWKDTDLGILGPSPRGENPRRRRDSQLSRVRPHGQEAALHDGPHLLLVAEITLRGSPAPHAPVTTRALRSSLIQRCRLALAEITARASALDLIAVSDSLVRSVAPAVPSRGEKQLLLGKPQQALTAGP